MRPRTAKEIVAANEPMYEHRRKALQPLARNNPRRHPWQKRTWWDWDEIHAELDEGISAEATQEFHKALALAPTLEVLEALLEGQEVPLERLDPESVRKYGLR